MFRLFIVFGIVILFGYSCDSKRPQESSEVEDDRLNTLTTEETQAGWKLLFDGKSFEGWRGLGRDHVPEAHWRIEDGAIHKVNGDEVQKLPDGSDPESGDLTTVDTYDNYELYFEWKILKAGNSGLKYNVSEELSKKYGSGFSALGFEYQLLDDHDPKYEGQLKPSQYTASLYDMIPSQGAKTVPAGEYNSSRIIIDGNHAEHWLNGEKVVEYEFGSERLDSAYQTSKFNKYEGFINKKKAHIILQNHHDDAWFRNIKIREIK
ncbi:MAG: DUF1080 domain-containing protein [Bacteroidota bacterium]